MLRYRIITKGTLPSATLDALDPLTCSTSEGVTAIEVNVKDDSHLYGIIEAIERVGASLQELVKIGE